MNWQMHLDPRNRFVSATDRHPQRGSVPERSKLGETPTPLPVPEPLASPSPAPGARAAIVRFRQSVADLPDAEAALRLGIRQRATASSLRARAPNRNSKACFSKNVTSAAPESPDVNARPVIEASIFPKHPPTNLSKPDMPEI